MNFKQVSFYIIYYTSLDMYICIHAEIHLLYKACVETTHDNFMNTAWQSSALAHHMNMYIYPCTYI